MTLLRDHFLADFKSKDFAALRLEYESNVRVALSDGKSESASASDQTENGSLMERLARDGAVDFSFFSPGDAKSLFDELEQQPVHDGHAPGASKGIEYQDYRHAPGLSYSHYPAKCLLETRVISDRILSDRRLQSIARSYLGAPTTLYDIGCFWAYPGTERHPFSQMWHRDWDDYKFLAFFTFLTDVDNEADGYHKFLLRSHLADFPDELRSISGVSRIAHMARSAIEALRYGPRQVRGYCGSAFAHFSPAEFFGKRKLHPYYERILQDRIRVFKGPRGTSFLEDAGGLHIGEVPMPRPRLLLWVRFGVTRPGLAEPVLG